MEREAEGNFVGLAHPPLEITRLGTLSWGERAKLGSGRKEAAGEGEWAKAPSSAWLAVRRDSHL